MNVHCSSSAISWMHRPAATAASLLGLNVATLGLGAAGVWRVLSHKCSRGYRCCMARSSCDLPMRSLAALTISSLPTISCLISPNGRNSPGLALPKRVSGGWSLLWLVVPRCFAFLECGESCVQIYDSMHTPVQVSAVGISATRYWSHSSLSLRRQTLLSQFWPWPCSHSMVQSLCLVVNILGSQATRDCATSSASFMLLPTPEVDRVVCCRNMSPNHLLVNLFHTVCQKLFVISLSPDPIQCYRTVQPTVDFVHGKS